MLPPLLILTLILTLNPNPKDITNIIDFPNLGLTYNGGWCSATKTR